MSPPPKWIAYASAALLWASVSGSPAATVISGLDPVFDTGSPDGWSGISVLMTPIAAPGDGSTEGVVTTFNFWAENGRADGGHRVTPLLLEFSGGSYKVIGIGTERAPTSAGAKSEPFGLVAGTDQVDLAAGVDYMIGVLQQADGVDDSNAGLIPFAGSGGSGVFQMNVAGPDHDPALDDVITAGHTSNAGGRNYAFNMEIDFASDPQPPSDIELAAGEIFPGMPPGTEFGTFSTTDPNSNDTHTYALVSNPGGVFAIDGDRLSLAMAPGVAGTSYTIRVRSTDGDALSFEKDFDIAVAAALPPTDITLSASSVTSGLPAGGLVGMLASVDANAGDSHVYTLAAGTGDFDNALFAVSGEELRLAAPVPEGRSSLSLRLRSTDLSGAWLEKAFVLAVTDPSVRINEFVASNVGLLGDEDGDTPDWIELFNEQAAAVNLGGWFLSDDPDDLTKWQIPPVSIGPSGYLVVFASGKGRAVAGAELHTNFQLSASGDFLALVKPDGETVADQFVFGQQFPDIAFGYSGGAGSQGFLTPTPGAANGGAFAEARNEVSFSHERGHYDATFSLTLSPLLPGSTIRYTTDGSKPSASNGTVYSGPITVSPDTGGARRGSRIIRAVALGGDAAIEKVATHTYLFVNGAVSPATDGVVNQSNLASSIKNHATYGPLLDDALLALPTVSIAGGLPGSGESERSLEFFVPDGTEPGFQLDAGLKVVGGHSVSSPKNNFRVYIRGQYGQSSLSYPLFEDHPYSDRAAGTFNRLNLRSGSHDSFFWLANAGNPPNSGGPQKGDAQYLRNRWINDIQLAMGHESQHGRYVQLYVNGEYRGQYQIHEWPNDDFTASYLGGEASGYEYTNGANTAKSGSDNWQAIWSTMKSAANTSYAAAEQWIDLENLADYMLLNFYAGNPWDWNPNQNWMASGPNQPGGNGWIFHGWDSDIIFQDPGANVLGQNVPDGVFNIMMGYEEFRVLFRDRIYRHCFHGGLLTPAGAKAVHDLRADEIRTSIVAETARWQGGGVSNPPWDRDGEWEAELARMVDYFDVRTDNLLDQLRARSNWYPLEAPEFDMRGGVVDVGHVPVLTAPVGSVYYTTDGSDPRLEGGVPNPDASVIGGNVTDELVASGSVWSYLDDGSDQGDAWSAVGFDDSSWASGAAELGYGEGDEATTVGFVDTDPGSPGSQRNITTYYRHTFNVSGASSYTGLQLRLKRDDGAVVYLNGQEIARSTTMPAGAIDYLTRASAASDDGNTFHNFTVGPGGFTLIEGANVLAVEIHQSSPSSSDTSFDLGLSAVRPSGGGGGLVINGSTVVRARVYDGSTWSALNEASFVITGTEPVAASNTTLTEINYNLPGEDSGEYLEFKNTGENPVDFSGAKLGGGVRYTFPIGTVVPPGGYLVVAGDRAAALARYGDLASPYHFAGIQFAPGEFEGSLSNGGEEISLEGVTGAVVLEVDYNDGGAWPGRADGGGSSLELADADAVPTLPGENSLYLNDGDNWRPSSEYYGSPGRAGAGPDNRVVFNEVLAHTDPPLTDRFELMNRSGGVLDVSGWVVSDSSADYSKFRIPAGTSLAAGGFMVFDEGQFNNPGSADNPVPFALSSADGDDLYLLETSPAGDLLRFVDRVEFGASKNGESFGRWPDGDGDLYPMLAPTFGATNSTTRPRVGPVVISEIHYNPAGSDDNVEFIEICNAGSVVEPLDNWRLRGEADFDFPAALSLNPGEAMILVPFDATNTALADAFYLRYGVPPTTPLFGPWTDGGTPGAKLDDGGAEIRLQRPDALHDPGDGTPPFYPMLTEDTAGYDDDPPWPASADGGGDSLLRVDFSTPGDFASSWVASGTPLGEQGYGAWAAAAFSGGTPAGDRVETADPDADGFDNFTEFAFAMDPETAQGIAPVVLSFSDDGGLRLTHRRRGGAHGLRYTVESSADLENWSELTTPTVVASEAGSVTLELDPGSGRLFLRVSALAD